MTTRNSYHGLLTASLILLFACNDKSDGSWMTPNGQNGTSTETESNDSLTDYDGDGYTSDEDCDDADGTINPGEIEVCDGTDNNCDGAVDEGLTDTYYGDSDGDGFGDSASTEELCEPLSGYVPVGGDCDDTDIRYHPGATELCSDPEDFDCDGVTEFIDEDGDGFAACEDCDDDNDSVNPDAVEVCDGEDNNCDGTADEGFDEIQTWYADTDGDTYGHSSNSTDACEQPAGYVTDNTDCLDTDANTNPAADELCDDLDNDCDGTIDEDPIDRATWYADTDGDTYGDSSTAVLDCDQPSGYVSDDTDCDDGVAAINPAATEVCDELDNDCDGTVDEDDAEDVITWYADDDGDGYGDLDDSVESCSQPSDYVADSTDCDDAEAEAYPSNTEICDDLDNDCDGDTDEDDAADAATWYADADADTYGDASSTTESCEEPSGYVSDDTDCDDVEPASYPSNTEICDGIDNDCDGDTDEDDASDVLTWYADIDGDGYGDPDDSVESCSQPSGYVADSTDCDDSVADAFPGNTEVCDSIDNDCDGDTDEDDAADASTWFADTDGDTYGDPDATTLSCDQPSGYVSNYLDCDDAEAEAYPSNTEVCDGIDNDCDGDTDEDTATDAATWYADTDGDTFGERSSTARSCEQPSGYVSDDNDCDDADAAINPDATEVCDSTDNDCDGTIDEDDAADAATWYADVDSDTYGDPLSSTESCDQPAGYVSDDSDCDDDAAAVNPDATELCDNVDNDCDGVVDEDDAANSSTWYADADGDTFGDSADATDSCDQPAGYVADDADCDDDNNDVNPAATEICNEIDDNCNGDIDDDDFGLDSSTGTTWYADTDVDTYGDVSNTVLACEQPSGFVADSDDCDDADTAVNPDATEVCDSIDNDCDGSTDEDDAADATTWYGDADGDTYGGTRFELTQCNQPSNYVANDTDCDDSDAAINPSATEVCNGEDDDCDGSIDEDSADDAAVWYADTDGDGYGDSATSATSCEPASGYVSDDTDCDDDDSAVNPAATEVCDGIDNDCDTTTDEDDAADAATWYADTDGDTYGDLGATTEACEEPSGYVADSDDCDDADAAINPAATEVCDAADNDCDGSIDEDSADDASVWYADTDGDGYGDSATSATSCEPASGYVADDTDCDDDAAAVNPAATEICNEIDDDCDSAIDDDDGSLDSTTGTVFYADTDGDTYGNSSSTTQTCDLPSGYVTDTTDCDDSAAAVNPAATEICDSIDNDCDTLIDDDDDSVDSSTGTVYYADTDGDTYGDLSNTIDSCSLPSGYVVDTTDCDDGDAAVNPAATEICDSIDNDCDTLIDDDDASVDSSTGAVYYADTDGDTYGDLSNPIDSCSLPSGYVVDDTDCDDSAAAVNPAATEVCNEIDDDCDSLIDDDDADLDATTGTTWYADTDGDTYGNSSSTTQTCDLPSGYVADDTDCDDGAAAVNPAATEICNEIDDDCDSAIDDDDGSLDSTTGTTWYADTDGDTYGDVSSTTQTCDLPSGYVADDDDCDDGAAAVNPAATEVCNEIDDDCDSLIDDDDADLDATTGTTWYADTDGDTYGDSSSTTQTCDLPSGYVSDDTDCDDDAAAVNPAASEICDSIDNDCDSLIDDDDSSLDSSTGAVFYADTDGDTYGDASDSVETCDLPSGYVSDDTDCDDDAAAVNPAASEVCNEIDDDCDTLIDDDDSSLDSSTGTTWYADSDGDTYGDSSSTTQTCDLPSGYVSDDDDCDDGDA
ncbi:MAG: putative metal-binding motif-containing protein, partial [Myxococcota bacterium]|nr:putative metal-binding motif-containing protein [Myxococcota bacterium]